MNSRIHYTEKNLTIEILWSLVWVKIPLHPQNYIPIIRWYFHKKHILLIQLIHSSCMMRLISFLDNDLIITYPNCTTYYSLRCLKSFLSLLLFLRVSLLVMTILQLLKLVLKNPSMLCVDWEEYKSWLIKYTFLFFVSSCAMMLPLG